MVSFAQLAAAAPVDREQQAAGLVRPEGQLAVRVVKQAVALAPEWRAVARPVAQCAPAAVQRLAAALASGKVLLERWAEFLQERRASSVAPLPASSSRALPLGRV